MTMFFIWAERMPFSSYIDPRVGVGMGEGIGPVNGDRSRNAAQLSATRGDDQVHHRVRSGTEATVVGLIAPHDSVVGLGSNLATNIQELDLRPDLSTLQDPHAQAPTANGGSSSPNFSGVADLLEQLWVADRDERPTFEQLVAMLKDGENLVHRAVGGASSV